MDTKIIILGGGVAGLATAVELAARGMRPVLLEEKQFLGGRAYSFADSQSGEILDNGQHVLLSCYGETQKFLKQIRTDHLLQTQQELSLPYREPDGKAVRVDFRRLKGPAIARNGDVKAAAKPWVWMRLAAALWPGSDPETLDRMTVDEWLDRCGQPADLRRLFHHPVAIAALNQSPAKASAAMWVSVLKRTIGISGVATIAVPSVGLSQLLVDKAREFLIDNGGKIITGARVTRMEWRGTRIRALETADGRQWSASVIVSALPAHALWGVLPRELILRDPALEAIGSLDYSGIISVYLWPKKPLEGPAFEGLLEGRMQWLFRRKGSNTLCMVQSAAELLEQSPEEIYRVACEDIARAYPGFGAQDIQRWRVIKERRATISHRPGQLALRPGCTTSIENLMLAGDWTNTGLPATIEGAIKSGRVAAAEALRRT